MPARPGVQCACAPTRRRPRSAGASVPRAPVSDLRKEPSTMIRRRLALLALPLVLGLAIRASPPAAGPGEGGAPPPRASTSSTPPTRASASRSATSSPRCPGRFTAFSGTIQFDPAKPAATQVDRRDRRGLDQHRQRQARRAPAGRRTSSTPRSSPKITFKSTAVKLVGRHARDDDRRPHDARRDQAGDPRRRAAGTRAERPRRAARRLRGRRQAQPHGLRAWRGTARWRAAARCSATRSRSASRSRR